MAPRQAGFRRRDVLWKRLPGVVSARTIRPGWCPLCASPTVFLAIDPNLREGLLCLRCRSSPRGRVLYDVLQAYVPSWRSLRIHESSPTGPLSRKVANECPGYVATRYLPGVPKGTVRAGYRCENLEEQTFPDEAFDIVITQDVFEHVLDPARAFHEVARTLRPGGVHVFTVPYRYWKPSIVRAVPDPSASGGVRYLLPKDYHEDPIEPEGSLVVTEWGWDLPDLVHRSSGLFTTIIRSRNPQRGIPDPSPEVFLSHKSPTNTSATVLASVAGVNGNLGAGESKNRI